MRVPVPYNFFPFPGFTHKHETSFFDAIFLVDLPTVELLLVGISFGIIFELLVFNK